MNDKYPPIERRKDHIFLSAWPGAKYASMADLRPDQPCGHPGCLHHVTHPCEWCGRIAGRWPAEQCGVVDLKGEHCPNPPTRIASIDGEVVHLCEQCYQNHRERLVDEQRNWSHLV